MCVKVDWPIAIRACHPDSLSERATARRFADFVRVQREVLDFGRCSIAAHLIRLALVHVAYRALRGIHHTASDTRGQVV